MTPRPFIAAATAILLAAGAAQAQFPTDAAGPVPILSNDVPALNAINERARGCATPELTVTANQTTPQPTIRCPP